jgi:ABC-type phosphate transport system substrate-binding protein
MVRANLIVLTLLFCALALPAEAEKNQIVAGAGPSTATAKAFFSAFSHLPEAEGYSFMVMEASVKHKGGIENAKKFLFGRTGRPLTDDEKKLGNDEIILAKVPIAFAKGLEVDVNALSLAQIEAIFTRKIKNWKEVGGADAPILLIGRERGEALSQVLLEDLEWFRKVEFDQKFKTDNEVMNFLKSPLGRHAISFGARSNFSEFNLLEMSAFSSGVKLGLVYNVKNRSHPLVEAARRFAQSAEWNEKLAGLEMLPVGDSGK